MSRKQIATDRRRDILRHIKEGDSVRVTELAKRYYCSPHTIRNDLSYLRELGIEVKTKKGIIAPGDTNRAHLVRQIKFPAIYKEAGISILSYFSKILEEKCPESDAEVMISQHGDTVKLRIESDEGELTTIEKTLTEFGKVVKGDLAPSEFLNNDIAVLELSNKLELAKIELKLKEQTFLLINDNQTNRVNSLENQVTELRELIGKQLNTMDSFTQALITSTHNNNFSPAVSNMMDTISRLAEENHTIKNEDELKQTLLELKQQDPTVFKEVVDNIKSFANSIAANMTTHWMIGIVNALPK